MERTSKNSLAPLKETKMTPEEEERILRNLRAIMQAEETAEIPERNRTREFRWNRAKSLAAGLAAVASVGCVLVFTEHAQKNGGVTNGPSSAVDESTSGSLLQSAASSSSSAASTTASPAPPEFNNSTDWVSPNLSSYSSGLSSVKTPKVPSDFEQSVPPAKGIADIFVSSGTGVVKDAMTWKKEIEFPTDSFDINGQTYTAPAKYSQEPLLILPVDGGIVWSVVDNLPGNVTDTQQALQGTTDIYFTPYQPHGGSLTKGAEKIAELPHRWMGIDGPVAASAWTGWLSKNKVAPAHVMSTTTYHMHMTKSGQLKTASPVQGAVPGWPTLFMQSLSQAAYYKSPHYASYIGSLTRTRGGFVLEIHFRDVTNTGRNSGLESAEYYWSEATGKWTPLCQNYMVQDLSGGTTVGSNGVYWTQTSPIGDGSGNELDMTEMHFDPATLQIQAVWLGNWMYGENFVDGNSWITVLSDDMPTSTDGSPKKWTVYTP